MVNLVHSNLNVAWKKGDKATFPHSPARLYGFIFWAFSTILILEFQKIRLLAFQKKYFHKPLKRLFFVEIRGVYGKDDNGTGPGAYSGICPGKA